MDRLEILASEIAMLSNVSLQKLADILARDYNPRANVLECQLNTAMFEQDLSQRGDVVNL
jgi:hypothetical protein